MSSHVVLAFRKALAAVLLCLSGSLVAPLSSADESAESLHVPAQVFAGEPRGAYETGTIEELWVDEELLDPSTAEPRDKRKVMVQMWYPATRPKRARLAPYAISPQLYGKDHWVHRLGHVRTRSWLDAAPAAGRFPVIIYNHGGIHPHFSATFQTEFLASHGYVVVSIGHPGANLIERFPDGTSYTNDGAKWMARRPPGETLAARDDFEYRWANSDLGLFVKDIGFVLDRLAVLDADSKHRFHGRLDLDRVGSLGWSLGGFISLQAARDEPRIKAAANLDGWPYGLMGSNGPVTHGSTRPVLLMFTADNEGADIPAHPGGAVDPGQVEAGRAASTHYWTMLRRSTADWYHVTVARVNHEHFSDRTLFQPADPKRLHPRAAHAIANSYVLEFFDKYVRGGRDDTPLLSADRHFPEATLLRPRNMPSSH